MPSFKTGLKFVCPDEKGFPFLKKITIPQLNNVEGKRLPIVNNVCPDIK